MRARIAIMVLLVAAAGAAAWAGYHQRANKISAPPADTAAPKAKPAAPLDPLEIEAIRARQYTASPIATERSLGNQGGYSTSVVSFSSDGLKEYALMATPDSPSPADGYPVIILCHGYIPPAQYRTDSSDYLDWIAAWARAGFVVIKPDYRGNGQSQGDAGSGHYSPDYTYDVLNLVASLKQYSGVNGSRIGIAGHSLGGHIALRAAVASPDIKALVIANGVVGSMYDLFYNWPHSPAPHDQPTATVKAQLQDILAKYGNPKSNPDFWNAASAINYVKYVNGPVQINQDQDDSTVPYLFAQHLDGALTAAHKSVTFYAYPGDDHQFASAGNHSLVIQRTTNFFKQNL